MMFVQYNMMKSMAKDVAFKDYVVRELLRGIDVISARAMFGGWGIYRHGLFFALIADGVLYFKVDDSNKADYESAGSKPFVYHSPKGKPMQMGYYEVPEQVMENQEEIKHWVEKSYAVAIAAKKKKK